MNDQQTSRAPWRETLYTVIFGADTRAGKGFDLGLMLCIVASVLVVMIDSIPAVHAAHAAELHVLEWGFTLLFSVEYVLRLICAHRPVRYARSFYGLVDLLAVLPTYASVLLPGTQYLLVIRVLRVLRIFRVLKLVQYMRDANVLTRALWDSRRKITVFFATVITLVVILGSLMYLIEGEAGGFTSIPRSIYWAVVTLTTVGYGDISPVTAPGRTVASLVMILGYSIIAVPTGIVTVAMGSVRTTEMTCPRCGAGGHARDARYCHRCGEGLNE